ncbi:MAG: DUF3793 family protein [Ruminococcus sp.]|nr:DUF3793 family protein [Ruminococcus sp.]MCD7800356.1 DUF3793 family protein [Ruminococcus sp.]
MLRESFIEYCSPTLASLKVASLFRYTYSTIDSMYSIVRHENLWLNQKGVYLEIITYNEKSALIYMFREKQLNEILGNAEVQEFLSSCGYSDFSISSSIQTLKSNFKSMPCPHEVGVFLGYPLPDVISFIENCGKNCECCGYWKVYHNKNEALKTFQRFKKCTNVYKRLFSEGTSIKRLTVAI